MPLLACEAPGYDTQRTTRPQDTSGSGLRLPWVRDSSTQAAHGHVSTERKRTAFRLKAKGWRLLDIAREIGCTAAMVGLMVRERRHLDAKPFGWELRSGCLTIDEREEILIGIHEGDALSKIARQLGRSPSTICREVNANGGREQHSACKAHMRARAQSRRPKPFKLHAGRLLDEVSRRLLELWSPDEISNRLKASAQRRRPDCSERSRQHSLADYAKAGS